MTKPPRHSNLFAIRIAAALEVRDGQSRRFDRPPVTSGLPRKADNSKLRLASLKGADSVEKVFFA